MDLPSESATRPRAVPRGALPLVAALCAMALGWLGLCEETMTEPFGRLADAERMQVRAVLEECGLSPRAS